MTSNEVQLSIGDFLQALGVFPSLAFFVHYVIVRPLQKPKITPWFRSNVGIMMAMLSLGLFLQQAVVVLSLTLGQFYPGRAPFRLFGFGVGLVAVIILYVTFVRESRAADPAQPNADMPPADPDTH